MAMVRARNNRLRSLTWLVLVASVLAACAGPGGKAVVIDRSYKSGNSASVPAGAYVVQRGDTVYGVAQRNGVSTRALIDWNRLRPPYLLVPGQALRMPQSRDYTVQRGDSVYAISRRFGVDMTTIVRLNNIPSPYTIHVGQRLQLPANAGPGSQVASTSAQSTTASTATAGSPARPTSKPSVPTQVVSVPRPPARAGGGFVWPVEGRVLSSFGSKTGGRHNDGVNIAAPRGTPVRAAENGVVAYAGKEIRGFGNLLLIKHDGGLITAYAHADALLVARGDVVTRGQVIAKVGKTGGVDNPQLHFEVRRGTKAVDPGKFLPS
ncbi:MAG: M23 family metallopeptidase [Rhodospirillaceae bacterium]|jgi:murein DD-endopeptidase MepM/ murein hydrolase activator NlpD|nr:M23 family metallopeptidase [Rhodospirillaceae bacterium]MBT3931273.1 M23 family metallopeptidase [Rhodospirillaceae bacterium]MBT4771477.1 M23 family metallopeptidase [Rhodospirillaceae bacterium]MBT5356776.1 M23 family metallopeptidase [Rhodospirillaceae bacterium]MBT5770741.1 M23 family metallopeptidase [Rhodospirillaceae bacterium]